MNAHDTPSGTRMMWNIKVNAICALAQGTGSTPASTSVPPNVAIILIPTFLCTLSATPDRLLRKPQHASPPMGEPAIAQSNFVVSAVVVHEPAERPRWRGSHRAFGQAARTY